MVRLTGMLSCINRTKIMVIGDFLLDAYTFGKAKRISPEAPVAIVNVHSQESRAGGAGNVVLNLVSLGAEVVAVGRIGLDASGNLLRDMLALEGVDVRGIFAQADFSTPVKNRIIAENQQIVRIDHECLSALPELLEERVIDSLAELLEGVKIIAISDYGKGFLSRTLLSALIDFAKERKIPVITDPKGVDFTKYAGTTIIKPNLGEAYAAANLPAEASLDQVAQRVLELTQAEVLMITRSEAGISLFHRSGERQDFPVHVREVKDVTGAGDTVLAMLTSALSNELPIAIAAQLSNVAAGIALEHLGCARVSLQELACRLLKDDIVNKVFDREHLFALQEALRGKEFHLLALSGSQGLTSAIFKAIQSLGQSELRALLIYVCDPLPDEEFVQILASLHYVNFIVLDSENLQQLCQVIKPQKVHLVDQSGCLQLDSIHSLF